MVQVDEVIVNQVGPGVRPPADHSNEMTARGTCTYTNLYAGPSHIDCTASTGKGPFSAAFLSDGKPPTQAHR
ncbi:hypothetical protein [Sphingomonas sp.]|uniref:hypothetical protein n=1 Tax=Sphingomonas sp. TaxID=28214 RepID=UPI0025EBED99|nr:hypothetical protein [Sphingomonas sp.]